MYIPWRTSRIYIFSQLGGDWGTLFSDVRWKGKRASWMGHFHECVHKCLGQGIRNTIGRVVQWIECLTTDQVVPGSSPGVVGLCSPLCHGVVFFYSWGIWEENIFFFECLAVKFPQLQLGRVSVDGCTKGDHLFHGSKEMSSF